MKALFASEFFASVLPLANLIILKQNHANAYEVALHEDLHCPNSGSCSISGFLFVFFIFFFLPCAKHLETVQLVGKLIFNVWISGDSYFARLQTCEKQVAKESSPYKHDNCDERYVRLLCTKEHRKFIPTTNHQAIQSDTPDHSSWAHHHRTIAHNWPNHGFV